MILITGATGFLGHHLLKELVSSETSIRATYRKGSDKALMEIFPQVEWVEADLLDVSAIEMAMKNVKKVFHCAAMVSFNPSDRQMMEQVNIDGTINLVNCALSENIEKFIHTSSVAAIGRSSEHNTVDESNEWESKDVSFYSKTKHKAEMEVWRAMAEGLNAVIVNPSIILGEWKWNLGTGRFFQRADKEPSFYTKGISGFVDVKDVAKAMILLSESEIANERFLLNSENLPFKEVFDQIADQIGKKKATYEANDFLSSIAWRAESLRSFLTKKPPLITKETAKSANSQYHYSNQKFLLAFPDFQFTKIHSVIQRVAKSYLENKIWIPHANK